MIKLIYARDYYIEENYVDGDNLVEDVEKNKNKTPAVISFLQEIKENKLLYKDDRIKYHTRKRKI